GRSSARFGRHITFSLAAEVCRDWQEFLPVACSKPLAAAPAAPSHSLRCLRPASLADSAQSSRLAAIPATLPERFHSRGQSPEAVGGFCDWHRLRLRAILPHGTAERSLAPAGAWW